MTVLGIRPDFIRMSEVIKRLDRAPGVEHTLVLHGMDPLFVRGLFGDVAVRGGRRPQVDRARLSSIGVAGTARAVRGLAGLGTA